jgi:hypothetical protein
MKTAVGWRSGTPGKPSEPARNRKRLVVAAGVVGAVLRALIMDTVNRADRTRATDRRRA